MASSRRGVFRQPSRIYFSARRRRYPPSLAGPPHGTGEITATATLTGSGTKHAFGTGTPVSAAAALTGVGHKNGHGTGTITAAAGGSGSGTGVIPGEVTLTLAIDWDGDGDFTGPGEDVTQRVLASGAFTASYGRDQARALSPPASGRAAWTLNNISRDYSPDNPSSPLAGDVLPAREVLAEAEIDDTIHVLFRGHIDDFDVKVERNSYTVDCTALDPLAKLKDAKISTQLYQGIRTGTAIGHILDAVGWPSGLRDLDPGATTIRWWWEHNADAWDAILKLVGSEGPGAIIHANEDGGIVFRDRHHRLLRTASTTSQATLTDGTDGYEPAFSAMGYDHGWRDIINSVTATVEERDPAPELETVWESADVRSIAASSSITIDIETNEPVLNPSVAYDTVAGAVTATVTQLTAQALQLQFSAGGSAAAVAQVVVSARPVAVRRSYQVAFSDSSSTGTYGLRSSPVEAPWAGVHDAEAIAQLMVGARAERLPVATVDIRGASIPDRTRQQIGRDLSDRVHIAEAQTGVDADFFLEKISHRIVGGGFIESTFGLEKAATQVSNVFRFDDSDHGFNDGVFGTSGLDDPAHLFLFDVAGHGFNDGVFAT